MCGILGVYGEEKLDVNLIKSISSRMSHRGPDEHDFHLFSDNVILTHERLAIIDLTTGKQPIQGTDKAYVVHNGEIYNHQSLRNNELKNHTFRTTCDSEVIVHLFEEYGDNFCNMLDGIFTFVVSDGNKFIVGRDPIGVKPLYWGKNANGTLFFSSELKAIEDQVINLSAFPPGHYFTPEKGLVKYFNPSWEDYSICTEELDLVKLRDSLINATRKRLMSDVPIGVLLSGGLDSSLTSAIAYRELKKIGNTEELHSFSIGLDENSPDVKAANEVASFLGTTHHNVYFTVEEGIKILDKLVWHLETYDVTSIRASTPMYFLSKYIHNLGIKVVLSGEGSDEIFGGYLYFHNAPNLEEFQKETIRRVQLLSTSDCLRADKSTMAWGIEARVPFLDKSFLEVAIKIDPKFKQPSKEKNIIEKYILRKAFDDKENPWLPENILWRQKEQFSDGVGYNWIEELMQHCANQISDEEFLTASALFPHNTPTTKEAFYMRRIFHKHYPSENAAKTVLKWVPKWQENQDPSGRASKIHEQTTEEK
ncbi:MAG: asparagine synthase B [Solirubrobacteraceae bacterium]